MEIKLTTKQILKILYAIAWVIFISFCIEAGGFIFNAFYTLVINPVGAHYFWEQLDLSKVYDYDKGYFATLTSFMVIVAVMRSIMFYLIIKIFHDNKLDLSQPFNKDVSLFISRISYLTIAIGLFCSWGVKYSEWIIEKGIQVPDIQQLRLGGADVWLFMGIVLFVIAQMFKRGMEIQSENDLTI